MPHDIPALTEPAAGPEDYDSIHSAVMESPRGRWFLTEYMRRGRQNETVRVLEAIARIEEKTQGKPDFPANDDLRRDFDDIAAAIAGLRRVDEGRARELAELMRHLERRIAANAAPAEAEQAVETVEPADTAAVASAPAIDEAPAIVREEQPTLLAPIDFVPPPPRQPVEHPPTKPAPVPEPQSEIAVDLTELDRELFAIDAEPQPAVPEAPPPAPPERAATKPPAQAAMPAYDPLAAVKAMTPEEQVALFS